MKYNVGDIVYISTKTNLTHFNERDELYRGKKLKIVNTNACEGWCKVEPVDGSLSQRYMYPNFFRKTKPPKIKPITIYNKLKNKDGQF